MPSAPGAVELTAKVIVPIQFKTSGCVFSIVASVVLTIVLNILLRSCT
jgi:NifU-like protein involved in Fe-S cluster formation